MASYMTRAIALCARRGNNMPMAQYEWQDDTGLRHPSLVLLDVTGARFGVDFENGIDESKVMSVRRIESAKSMFRLGKVTVRAPRGYRFCWQHTAMDQRYYALFVAFERKGAR